MCVLYIIQHDFVCAQIVFAVLRVVVVLRSGLGVQSCLAATTASTKNTICVLYIIQHDFVRAQTVLYWTNLCTLKLYCDWVVLYDITHTDCIP